jgi:hypothetical protein
MKQIKSKLSDYTHKMPVSRHAGISYLTQDNDQLTKNIMISAHIKPAITSSTYYLFPT